MTVNRFLKLLKTSQLIAMYNYANPTNMVNKFADHETAIKRVAALVKGTEYSALYQRFAKRVHGVVLPPPEDVGLLEEEPPAPEPEPEPKPKPIKEKKPKENSPHLNLRRPTCKYYIKTTAEMLAIARPNCPANIAHGKLLTANERGEKRGR